MKDIVSVRREQRLITEAAVFLWSSERAKWVEKSGPGYSRFTDRRALSNLRVSCRRAINAGEWRDIEAAIRAYASKPDANPWYLDEWTREQWGMRREAERIEIKERERQATMAMHPVKYATREFMERLRAQNESLEA